MEQYEVWEGQREKREKADPLWLQGLEKLGPSGYVGGKLRACDVAIAHTVSLTPRGEWGQ